MAAREANISTLHEAGLEYVALEQPDEVLIPKIRQGAEKKMTWGHNHPVLLHLLTTRHSCIHLMALTQMTRKVVYSETRYAFKLQNMSKFNHSISVFQAYIHRTNISKRRPVCTEQDKD